MKISPEIFVLMEYVYHLDTAIATSFKKNPEKWLEANGHAIGDGRDAILKEENERLRMEVYTLKMKERLKGGP